MTDMNPARIDDELGTIEGREREDERRAAEREAAQTESIINALTQRLDTPQNR